MRRINGDKVGRWSLRFDAVYCAVLGLAVAFGSSQIAQVIALPSFVIAVVGLLVVAWAGMLWWMLSRLPLRLSLRLVMVANVAAAIAVGFVSIAAATALIAVAVLAVAFDVALFAISQAVALRSLPVQG